MIAHLVVIRKWNDWCTHSQDHGGVDFTMGVCRAISLALLFAELLWRHGNHDGLLLIDVNVLHHSTCHQILPTVNTKRCGCHRCSVSWWIYDHSNNTLTYTLTACVDTCRMHDVKTWRLAINYYNPLCLTFKLLSQIDLFYICTLRKKKLASLSLSRHHSSVRIHKLCSSSAQLSSMSLWIVKTIPCTNDHNSW